MSLSGQYSPRWLSETVIKPKLAQLEQFYYKYSFIFLVYIIQVILNEVWKQLKIHQVLSFIIVGSNKISCRVLLDDNCISSICVVCLIIPIQL